MESVVLPAGGPGGQNTMRYFLSRFLTNFRLLHMYLVFIFELTAFYCRPKYCCLAHIDKVVALICYYFLS